MKLVDVFSVNEMGVVERVDGEMVVKVEGERWHMERVGGNLGKL